MERIRYYKKGNLRIAFVLTSKNNFFLAIERYTRSMIVRSHKGIIVINQRKSFGFSARTNAEKKLRLKTQKNLIFGRPDGLSLEHTVGFPCHIIQLR